VWPSAAITFAGSIIVLPNEREHVGRAYLLPARHLLNLPIRS